LPGGGAWTKARRSRGSQSGDDSADPVGDHGDLLAEGVSFADITVDGIAQRAGISRTAFYDYFSDRRELLMKLVEVAVAPIFRDAEEEAGGPRRSCTRCLRSRT
jgi:hypothetical protein